MTRASLLEDLSPIGWQELRTVIPIVLWAVVDTKPTTKHKDDGAYGEDDSDALGEAPPVYGVGGSPQGQLQMYEKQSEGYNVVG